VVDAARLRLFCLPYAGGGASAFQGWAGRLPEKIELCPIQLPGRESRMGDCPYEVLDALAQVLAGYLKPWLDMPCAFFGHELGALIAFELTRQLRRLSAPVPVRLFVAGCAPPHLPAVRPSIHLLPDQAFVDALNERLCVMPDAVLGNRELLARILPGLRADFAMLETYTFKPGERLDCPITAFGGQEDSAVTPEALTAWSEHTSTFSQQTFPGDRFFLSTAEDRVLAAIAHQLLPDIQ
jgi:surfactin synthase thioesterase subunit